MAVTVNIKLPGRTLTGLLHAHNRAADWGWQGLLAYGCQSLVMIVDPKTCQTIQSLDKHKTPVVKVKWARENYHHDLAAPYCLRLASGDTSGKIIVWDVANGTPRCEIQEFTKPVQDINWLWSQEVCHDLLLAVHPPNYIVLWNADTGTKLWKKSYAENILSLSFDPFEPSNLAMLTSEGIVFVHDFSVSKPPPSAGRKVYISSPNASPVSQKPQPSGARKALHRMKTLITDEKPSTEMAPLTECLQMEYLPSHRGHLLLLYSRELLVLDLEVSQTVAMIAIEKSGVPFLQAFPCRQRDAFYCLHENGCITLRLRRSNLCVGQVQAVGDEADGDVFPEVIYDLRCQSDPIRVTKTVKPIALACCPVGENSLALLVSDGRLLLWDLKASPAVTNNQLTSMPQDAAHRKAFDISLDAMVVPCLQFSDEQQRTVSHQEISLKFLLSGLLSSLPSPPFILRMCPPLTTKNLHQYQPLLAIGTTNGSVLVYHLTSGLLYKEFSIHTCDVKGIEWVSLTAFLSYASSTSNNQGLVRNELQLVDLPTGRSMPFRGDRGVDEPPIEMLKISQLKQYVIVVFRDKPMELWDLHSCSILREMSKSFPNVSALEWSPSHNLRSLRRKQLAAREAMVRHTSMAEGEIGNHEVSMLSSSTISLLQEAESKAEVGQNVLAREHFVFTDPSGLIYHFTVEGTGVKEGARIPPDVSMGSISSIAWKGDTLVLGDVDGNLNFWDLKAKLSRGIPTHRGWVRKLRFAPGKGNSRLLVLYNDGVEIWDSKEVRMVSSLRAGRTVPWRISDGDWSSSDKSVLACDDGCIRVMDTTLRGSTFHMQEQELTDALWCPYLLQPKMALALKAFLQHQPCDQQYTLDFSTVWCHEGVDVKKPVQEHLDVLSNEHKSLFLDPKFTFLQRLLLTARLFGDESELHFWMVSAFYLQHYGVTHCGEGGAQGKRNLQTVMHSDSLDTCYDVLCENSFYQKWQLERAGLQESKRTTYTHTRQCADKLLLLGQMDRAVQLLLETGADSPGYYCDSLKACLVTTLPASGPSQSTIKLVATNMIASGKLEEGVQLLCLINKAADACRYLQTYGHWNQAVWLAKVRLIEVERADVLRRWAEQLCSSSVNQKPRALLVLLSLGAFDRVVTALHGMRYFDRAAQFLDCCLKHGTLEVNSSNRSWVESVFADYIRYLQGLGLNQIAAHYMHRTEEDDCCHQEGSTEKLHPHEDLTE
uniref:WD repeat domain 11 n=1 Tax=Eptatretus burgeri TaxID=7764 RepID=A0A8C4QUC4_EPTBU